jgi:hypothetical protein
VLSQVLSRCIDDLFPDARDEEGPHMLIKIDGGPGHPDFNTLAEMRLHGGQNTTHAMQETDISYG